MAIKVKIKINSNDFPLNKDSSVSQNYASIRSICTTLSQCNFNLSYQTMFELDSPIDCLYLLNKLLMLFGIHDEEKRDIKSKRLQ